MLVADDSFSWAALATTFVLQQDLATSTSIVPFFAKDQSSAYGQGATAALRTTLEMRRGRVRVAAVVTDLATQKNTQTIESEGAASDGLIARLDGIAKRLDSERAGAFSTRSDKALEQFTAAAAAPTAEARHLLLGQAVALDPAFGLAQTALLEIQPGSALANPGLEDKFVPLDRARYRALRTRISSAPIDVRAKAETAVLRLAPNSVDALAQLGSLSFLQNKPDDGDRLLGKAIALSSQPLGLQLQLAQGLVSSRRFPQAIRLLDTLSGLNPSVLPGLAAAKLLNGDAGGANASFSRFVALLPPNTPARAFAEEQWKAIVEKRTPNVAAGANNTPLATGYRAFLERRFPEAISFWQSVLQGMGGTDLRARAMLAASLEGAGQSRKVEVLPYLPDLSDPYASVAFNEMRRLLKM